MVCCAKMRISGLWVAVLVAGCGGSDGGTSGTAPGGTGGGASASATGGSGGAGAALAVDAGTAGDAGNGVGTAGASAYPAGPYGNQIGSVLPNLELLGYVRHDTTGLASDATLESVNLQDVRASAPRPYAMIHISGFT